MDRFEKFFVTAVMTPQGDPNLPTTIWGLPLNVIGGSGVGKTSRANQLSRFLRLPYYPIYGGTKSPEHFGGVPVGTPNGFTMECILPQVIACMEAKKGVIHLDEISTTPAAVQAALLSFVNERQVGDYVLPPGVRIILSMNPSDIAANGQELEIPMVNRLAHIEYTPPNVDQWSAYMQSLLPGVNYDHDIPSMEEAEEKVKSSWSTHFAAAEALTTSFLKANAGTYQLAIMDEDGNTKNVKASKLYSPPEPDDPRATQPWSSHRTWSLSVFGVAAARCLEMGDDIEMRLVASLVGEGLATEWIAYMRSADLPPPEVALSGQWKMPQRLDVIRAVLNSCVMFIRSQNDNEAKVKYSIGAWNLLKEAMGKGGSDIVVPNIQHMLSMGMNPEHENKVLKKIAQEVCASLHKNGQLAYMLKARQQNRRPILADQ